jgi:hypothetical protein
MIPENYSWFMMINASDEKGYAIIGEKYYRYLGSQLEEILNNYFTEIIDPDEIFLYSL